MERRLPDLLTIAARIGARGGAHAELARQVVVLLIFAEMLAASDHGGPPHAGWTPPRPVARRRSRPIARASLAGRRPRG